MCGAHHAHRALPDGAVGCATSDIAWSRCAGGPWVDVPVQRTSALSARRQRGIPSGCRPLILSRREALRRIGSATATLAGASVLGRGLWDKGHPGASTSDHHALTHSFRVNTPAGDLPELAIAKNDADPASLVRKAVNALGGMKRFVSRGEIVVVKPNIGWDRAPIHAANTNPEVVAEVVRLAYDAGAKHVIVTDASCNEPNRCFQRSGIWKAAYDAGAEVLLPLAHHFRGMRLKGEVLDDWPVFTPLVNANKVINVPIAKHHNLARYTGAMKNWYGSLGGRRNRLHQNIDVSIADLAQFIQPTLTIVDANRVLMRNGPQGGNVADAKEMHIVLATTDQVAADAYGCELIGRTAVEIPYLKLGQERGLGTMQWQSLRLAEV